MRLQSQVSLRRLAIPVGLVLLVFLGILLADRWLLPRHLTRSDTFDMPLLEGSSRAEVYEICSARGLVISERPAEYDASLPNGYLLRQSPRAGSQIKRGRRVTAVFSAGPRLVVVPRLRGETERQVRLSLEDLGLLAGDVLRCPGQEPAGEILGSRPGSGSRVPVGSRVDLLVSTGPEVADYFLPDFRKRDLDEVLALLAESGLPRPQLRYQADRGPSRRILEQSPPPGSRLEAGRVLELVVSSKAR